MAFKWSQGREEWKWDWLSNTYFSLMQGSFVCVIVIKISTLSATAATDDVQRREMEPGDVMCVRRISTIPILYYIITICIGYVLQCCVCAYNVGLCRPTLKFYLRFLTDSINRKPGRYYNAWRVIYCLCRYI